MTDSPAQPQTAVTAYHLYILAFVFGVLIEFLLPLDFFDWGGQFAFGLPLMITGAVIALFAGDQLNRATGLVTTGAFAKTRNPVFAGLVLLYIGTAILLDTPMAIVMLAPLVLALNHYIVKPEERDLEARFGDDYRAYCASVKRWL